MGWLGGFVNPGLVAGVALCAVPLVIHLLNRQRHRPMQWAAMRFVLAAYRKTRRRVQVENLLLLLLRMLAVALLALAIARPFTGGDSPLASLTERRRDLVLVIDGSASTGYRQEVERVFDGIVERARTILKELDAGRGDRARLIFAGDWPRLLTLSDPQKALSMLDTLTTPTDESLDLVAALAEVLDLAREEAAGTGQSDLEVRLLTDLQRRSFHPRTADAPAAGAGAAGAGAATGADAEPEDDARGLAEVLDELQGLGVRVLIEDLGARGATPPNLGVQSVLPAEPIVGPGVPAEIVATVANGGTTLEAGVRVALEVDGERRPSQTIEVPARGEARAVFSVAFRDPGAHTVTALLEGDRLPLDDRRSRVVEVPPPLRVLAVNGAPGGSIGTIEEDELGFLMTILRPATDGDDLSGTATPFMPREVAPEDLRSEGLDLADYDVVWLANVEDLPASVVTRLSERVAAGAALVFSVGDRVVPATWNERFFAADGSGLLPAELARVVSVPSRRSAYFRVKEFDVLHPIFDFFREERWRALLTEVPVWSFIACRPLPDAHVLAALDDDGSSPLLVERPFDRGKVFLWTTTIDPAWSLLPEIPETLVPLVHELLRYAGRQSGGARNVRPGEALAAEVADFPRRIELVRPDGTRRVLDAEPRAVGTGRWALPPVGEADTARAGLYALEIDEGLRLPFAVQYDPAEGDLDRVTAAELADVHPALVLLDPEAEGAAQDPTTPQRGELWRWLAALCLGALVLESLWAAWIGHRRNTP